MIELIHAAVSHDMRNPINSIIFQNKNIEFLLQGLLKEISNKEPGDEKIKFINHKIKKI